MDCRDFDRLLGALLDGACTPDEWRRAEAHLAGCVRCRRLHEALSGRADTLDDAAHEALTASIIARTSGSSCDAARDRLCDFVDGALPSFDRGLVADHLARCPECAALTSALERSTRVLPVFAEVEPPAWFTSRVLAATIRRQPEPTFGSRVVAWLARAASRPRFSLEVAYALTVVLMLALGDPVKAVRSTSELGVSYVQPRAEVLVEKVAARLEGVKRIGAETAAAVSSIQSRPDALTATWERATGAVLRWLADNLAAPVRALVARMFTWMRGGLDSLERYFRGDEAGATPAARPDSATGRMTEPSGRAMRLLS